MAYLFLKQSQVFNSFGEKNYVPGKSHFCFQFERYMYVIMNIIKSFHFIGPNSLQSWLLCNMLAVISITFISLILVLNYFKINNIL